MQVSTDEEAWFTSKGAQAACGGTGNVLNDRQKKNVNFCCEILSSGDVCHMKAPRAAHHWLLGTGDVKRHKCGTNANPIPTTTDVLEMTYLGPGGS